MQNLDLAAGKNSGIGERISIQIAKSHSRSCGRERVTRHPRHLLGRTAIDGERKGSLRTGHAYDQIGECSRPSELAGCQRSDCARQTDNLAACELTFAVAGKQVQAMPTT